MGDLSFDHGAAPETSHLPPSYTDLWRTLHSEDLGATWDPTSNSYARMTDPRAQPSRPDRILIKSSHWKPETIDIFGDCTSQVCG